ncbi:MAG: hypothetical protein ACE5OZ_21680 [Candidatus Heimdallarchaeota archaeon]
MMSAAGQNPGEALIMLYSDSTNQNLEARLRWHRFIAKQEVQAENLSLAGLDNDSGNKNAS